MSPEYSDRRRQELIQLGRELFSVHPYDGLSIDKIAAAAGISKGLLYHYFASKRDFYVAVVRTVADEMRSLAEPDPELSPPEQLRHGLDAYLDYAQNHAAGFRAVLDGGVGSDPEVRAIRSELRTLYIERILEGLELDAPPDSLTLTMLRGWVGLVEAASLEWLDQGAPERGELVTALLRSLGSVLSSLEGR